MLAEEALRSWLEMVALNMMAGWHWLTGRGLEDGRWQGARGLKLLAGGWQGRAGQGAGGWKMAGF